jgi:hypothetical protein
VPRFAAKISTIQFVPAGVALLLLHYSRMHSRDCVRVNDTALENLKHLPNPKPESRHYVCVDDTALEKVRQSHDSFPPFCHHGVASVRVSQRARARERERDRASLNATHICREREGGKRNGGREGEREGEREVLEGRKEEVRKRWAGREYIRIDCTSRNCVRGRIFIPGVYTPPSSHNCSLRSGDISKST